MEYEAAIKDHGSTSGVGGHASALRSLREWTETNQWNIRPKTGVGNCPILGILDIIL